MLSRKTRLNKEEWATGEVRYVTKAQVQSPHFCFHY